ncbi:hypothetical protein Fmac_016749 [Flemingia macrophylla]|uniref:Uncharacterized protein n=1 Tax=Flemingia macrophylla TaxID=520843 RepID=A0ABD1MIH7_9FABA
MYSCYKVCKLVYVAGRELAWEAKTKMSDIRDSKGEMIIRRAEEAELVTERVVRQKQRNWTEKYKRRRPIRNMFLLTDFMTWEWLVCCSSYKPNKERSHIRKQDFASPQTNRSKEKQHSYRSM